MCLKSYLQAGGPGLQRSQDLESEIERVSFDLRDTNVSQTRFVLSYAVQERTLNCAPSVRSLRQTGEIGHSIIRRRQHMALPSVQHVLQMIDY